MKIPNIYNISYIPQGEKYIPQVGKYIPQGKL